MRAPGRAPAAAANATREDFGELLGGDDDPTLAVRMTGRRMLTRMPTREIDDVDDDYEEDDDGAAETLAETIDMDNAVSEAKQEKLSQAAKNQLRLAGLVEELGLQEEPDEPADSGSDAVMSAPQARALYESLLRATAQINAYNFVIQPGRGLQTL